MIIMERNSIKESIRLSLLELLKSKNYSQMFMTEIAKKSHVGRRTLYRYFPSKDDIIRYEADILMDEFAVQINEASASGLDKVMYTWFSFCLDHLEELLLLKKTHLLYFIEDNFPRLIMEVALKTKYKGLTINLDAILATTPIDELYEFYFELAGIWKLTILWLEDSNRKSPEEMSQIIFKIWQQ